MGKTNRDQKKLTSADSAALLNLLQTRFGQNKARHPSISWSDVEARLRQRPEKQWSLNEMESSGGEPDVVGYDKKTGEFIFCDCSPETPKGRRSICYDKAALLARKEHKPATSAEEMALAMGIDLLTEEAYRHLQQLGVFDTKTSSWLETPEPVRKLGGAIFGDRRYNRVFIYHNGAESYYGSRGFRGSLRV